MENKDKEKILLKEFSKRLPYGVKVFLESAEVYGDKPIQRVDGVWNCPDEGWQVDCEEINTPLLNVKPYLFPISGMTDSQCSKLFKILGIDKDGEKFGDYVKINDCLGIKFFSESGIDIEKLDKAIDYLYSQHIDFSGLIENGIALDATGLNIYINYGKQNSIYKIR